MVKRRLSRYDLLSQEQKEALDNREETVLLHNPNKSFVGSVENLPFFKKALSKFETSTGPLLIGEHLVTAFVTWSNEIEERNSLRAYKTGFSQFHKGLLSYMVDTNQTQIKLNEIDSDFVDRFEFWLRKTARTDKGKPLSYATQRKYYGYGTHLLKNIAKHPTTKTQISASLVFKKNAFPTQSDKPKKTLSLSKHDWIRLYKACRADVLETIARVNTLRDVINGPPIPPDEKRRGSGRYHDWRAALYRLNTLYPKPGLFPSYAQFKEDDIHLADAFQHRHGGVTKYLVAFYPDVETILPFVLLHGIYIHANTGPLRALLTSNVNRETLMDERIVYNIEKGRAHSNYPRSFAVDDTDPASPSSLDDFLTEWTARIRPHAGKHSRHVFIFRNEHGNVRGFLSAKYDGTDSDSSWNHAFKMFIKKHKLPNITRTHFINGGEAES